MGGLVGVHRQIESSRQHADTLDMITMFMGDDDRSEGFQFYTHLFQAVDNLLAGKAVIDEQAGRT